MGARQREPAGASSHGANPRVGSSELPRLRAEAVRCLHRVLEISLHGDVTALHAVLCEARNALCLCTRVTSPGMGRCPVREMVAEIDRILAGQDGDGGCGCSEAVRGPAFRALLSVGLPRVD